VEGVRNSTRLLSDLGFIGDDNQFDRRAVERSCGWTFPSD
jgi:hypothetical protein